ncbi:hypothetical protein [Erythrobacter sp. F6033]|uniref:hypothetical protein n=1 Tax=Erythrobacter sp. F6033 TaxID=2926401 RepID=UPI001FF1EF59|nr:hypothetical protein [Erythrobacter sp. F6033]MCK0129510.1 hypothetical protein [Erythrobacter sp. F6033]
MMSTPRKAFALTGAAALALLVGQPAVADDQSGEDAATEMTKGEKKLADILEGRVAGEPTRCIRTRPNERLRVIDDTAYVYGSGRTIYVQRTRHPDKIDRDDILVSRRFNASQICKLDIVHTVDRSFGMFNGAVFFDDFVPYTKADQAKSSS